MIFGITGTNGAGKGTVVEYLVERYGFRHCSVREEITQEIIARGLPVNRTSMNEVATDLREQHGPNYFSDLFIARAKEEGTKDIVIESIRNPFEADNIHAHGGLVLVVDADRKVRYDRIQKRASATDSVTFEEFVAQEDREMTSEDPTNPAKMSIHAVMERADYTFVNDGELNDLHGKIDAMMAELRSH